MQKIANLNGVTDFTMNTFKQEEEHLRGVLPLENDPTGTTINDEHESARQGEEDLIGGEDPNKHIETGVKPKVTLCSDKVILWNLMLMIVLWSVASLDYYLISFMLKYVPGNVYINASVSTISEIVGTMISGFVYKVLGPKMAFGISFSISALGGFLIALMPNVNTYLIALYVLIAKFGITFAFSMVYLITPTLFPTEVTATVFGICNVVARFATILSPILAEFAEPTPMLCYSFTAIAGLVASLLVVTNVKYD